MQFLPLTIFILILCLLSPTQGNSGKCDDDWECGAGFYCSSNFCETCIPCEKVFYRQSPSTPSGDPSCAKSVAQCAECLKGFQLYDLSDKKCYPQKGPISSFATSATRSSSAWTMFFLGWIAPFYYYCFV